MTRIPSAEGIGICVLECGIPLPQFFLFPDPHLIQLSIVLSVALSLVALIALALVALVHPPPLLSLRELVLVLRELVLVLEPWVHGLHIACFVPDVQKLNSSAGCHPILLLLQTLVCHELLDLWIG